MERYHQRNKSETGSGRTTAPASARGSQSNHPHQRACSRDRIPEASHTDAGSGDLSVQGSTITSRRSPTPTRRPKTAHRQRTPPHNHPRYAKSASRDLEKDFPLVRFESEPARRGILQGGEQSNRDSNPTEEGDAKRESSSKT